MAEPACTPTRSDGAIVGRARLSRDLIVEVAGRLIRDDQEPFTLSRLGEALGVDTTAVYRHFPSKDDLLRAVGDEALAAVIEDLPTAKDWRATVTTICTRLRHVHLHSPRLAELVRRGPPLNDNEFVITDRLLGAFRQAGCTPRQAAMAYHAVIELTIGSAALDAALANVDAAERRTTYDRWRATYRGLDRGRFAYAQQLAGHLYRGDADERFAGALKLVLDGVAAR